MLTQFHESLFADEASPLSLGGLLLLFLGDEDLFHKFALAQTECGAKTAIQFSLAHGVSGDLEKVYSHIPRATTGKKVGLHPFGARAEVLAKTLSGVLSRVSRKGQPSSSGTTSAAP